MPSLLSDREARLRELCEMLTLATSHTSGAVRLIAWIEARDENEGGFLWLAAELGYRPGWLAETLLATLDAPPRRRQAIERKLLRNGEAG